MENKCLQLSWLHSSSIYTPLKKHLDPLPPFTTKEGSTGVYYSYIPKKFYNYIKRKSKLFHTHPINTRVHMQILGCSKLF